MGDHRRAVEFASVEAAIAQIAEGRPVVVVDDEEVEESDDNENGEVVGVTNAGRELGAAQESLALNGQAVSPVVEQLLAGDVDHIGAQLGPIFWGPGFAWAVESVDPDSIAGDADLRRGDVIEQLGR